MSECNEVKVLRGKHAGKTGIFMNWTEPHPLSSKNRAAIRVRSRFGFRTLLINEDGFKKTCKETLCC